MAGLISTDDMPACPSSKRFAQRIPEIVLALFGCHCDILVFLEA
jgi:hypothetical protein